MPLRLLKNLEFHKWAKGEGLTNAMLCAAAVEIENGLVDARLGGFLIKKRVAASGKGKRGSYRTIAAHRQGNRLIFLHGFSKNEKDDISNKELKALRKLGDQYMEYSEPTLSKQVAERIVVEIKYHEQNLRKRP
jgi:hypothetical protein